MRDHENTSDWTEQIRKQLAPLRLLPARESEIVEELCHHAEDRYRELTAWGLGRRKPAASCSMSLRPTSCWPKNFAQSSVPMCRSRSSWRREQRAPAGGAARKTFATDSARLRRNLSSPLLAMLTLALGIGANTAIFNVVNGVLLRPLAYPDAGRLFRIFETTQQFSQSSVSYPDYLDWRRDKPLLQGYRQLSQ